MSSLWGAGCADYDINLPGVTYGNIHSAYYFAAAMGGLIVLFTMKFWVRYPYSKKSSTSMFRRITFAPFESLRGFALRKVLGFTSAGHAIVVSIYVAVNFILIFTMLDWPLNQLSDFGRRLGWVCVANIALLFFLALRNTPLAFLTEYSYERINILHQIAGYTTILLASLHTVIFIVARAQQNEICNILDIPQHPAMIAMGAMFIILITSLFLQGWKYEAFFIVHIIMAVLVLFGVGLHRPDFGTYSVQAIIFTAAIFIADQIIRVFRLISNKRNQRAILTPLTAGGTLIELTRPIPRAAAGKHACLMIGKLGRFQTHPFTIVSTDPVRFVVDTYSGFTLRLHQGAVKEPGVALPATLDGPYGTLPAFHRYEKVVLIAGGSGASFTIGVATALLKRLEPSDRTHIEFIWAVKDTAKLEWFTPELQSLQSSLLVTLSIYNTSTAQSEKEKSPSVPPSTLSPPNELDTELGLTQPYTSNNPAPPHTPSPLQQGRPNVPLIVRQAVRTCRPDERIVIAACGPTSLMNATRNAAAAAVTIAGPRVELHLEAFGW